MRLNHASDHAHRCPKYLTTLMPLITPAPNALGCKFRR
jgi:hypothetical protein